MSRPSLYPQYAALRGDPSDNLPGRARRRGEDGGQADQHLRRPRRDLRPPRRADAQAAREPGRGRGRRPPERRGHAARPRRPPRRRSSTTWSWADGTSRRSAASSTSSSSAPSGTGCSKPSEKGKTGRPEIAGRRRRRSRWRSSGSPAPRPPSSAITGLDRRGYRAGRRPPAWAGREGRSAIDGLAVVELPPARADGGVDRRRRCWPTATCWPRWPTWSARAGSASSTHDAKALMRGLAVMGVDFSHLDLDTAIAAYLVDPAGDQYLLEDLAVALRRHRAAGARRPAGRPARPGRGGRRRGRGGGPAGGGRRPAGRAARGGPVGPGPVAALRRDRAAPGAGAGPHGGRRRPGRRGRAAAAGQVADRGGPPAGARDPGAGRRAVHRQLHQAAARGPVRQAGPGPAEEDQDRLLHRRPVAREAARASTRSSSRCCATARSRSCARPTATACWPRWRPTAASTPRSTRRWPAPAGCRRTSPTCTTSRSAARRAASSGGRFIPAEGCRFLVADYNQIELRVIAHLAEDPGPDRGVPVGDRHPQRDRGRAIFGVEPGRRDPRPCGPRPRWSPTAWPTAWSPTAWPSGSASRSRRRPRSSTPTSWPFPTCGRTWTRWSPRPGAGATPRRCSAGAARSPSCRPATTGSARPASARP